MISGSSVRAPISSALHKLGLGLIHLIRVNVGLFRKCGGAPAVVAAQPAPIMHIKVVTNHRPSII